MWCNFKEQQLRKAGLVLQGKLLNSDTDKIISLKIKLSTSATRQIYTSETFLRFSGCLQTEGRAFGFLFTVWTQISQD